MKGNFNKGQTNMSFCIGQEKHIFNNTKIIIRKYSIINFQSSWSRTYDFVYFFFISAVF